MGRAVFDVFYPWYLPGGPRTSYLGLSRSPCSDGGKFVYSIRRVFPDLCMERMATSERIRERTDEFLNNQKRPSSRLFFNFSMLPHIF